MLESLPRFFRLWIDTLMISFSTSRTRLCTITFDLKLYCKHNSNHILFGTTHPPVSAPLTPVTLYQPSCMPALPFRRLTKPLRPFDPRQSFLIHSFRDTNFADFDLSSLAGPRNSGELLRIKMISRTDVRAQDFLKV